MSNDITNVFAIGRFTKDPIMNVTSGGTQIANFSIASNSYAGKDKEEKVSFLDVTAYGKLSEIVGQYMRKGMRVAVSGKLIQDRWEKDGKNMSKIKIVADSIQMLDGKKDNEKEQAY